VELKAYLEFLGRRWWLLALGAIAAGAAAVFVTQQMTPVYRATVTMLVNKTATPGSIDYTDVLTSERLTNTYAQLVERPEVMTEVINRLDLQLPQSDLAKKIEVSTITDTQLLSISVKDADPEFATTLANSVAQAFADDNASQLAPAGTVTIAKQAQTPRAPVSPKMALNLSFAIILGMLVAGGLGLLLDYLDDTVKGEDDVEVLTGTPTLATISRFRPETGPAFATEQKSRSAESYRQLRTNVHFTTLGSELKTIVITSANPDEGKSTTAANLASVLAQAGDRVILVDTDLRRSSLRSVFDGVASIGLTGLLLNESQEPQVALIPTRWQNLHFLPAGVLPPNPSELLTSARMIRVIDKLRNLADYVIFDTPPVLAVTDAIVLAARTDGTIVVTESGKTRREALRQTARTLSQANTRIIGVVLNKTRGKHGADYYYRGNEDKHAQAARHASHDIPVAAPGLAAGRDLVAPQLPAVAPPQARPQLVASAEVEPDAVLHSEPISLREAILREQLMTELVARQDREPSAQQPVARPQPAPEPREERPSPIIQPAASQRPVAPEPKQERPTPISQPAALQLERHRAALHTYQPEGVATWGSRDGAAVEATSVSSQSAAEPASSSRPAPAASNGYASTPDPFNETLKELMSRFDGTMGMIRSLKPEGEGR
jgi:capsular exopolysaccharide synthesis family protein